MNASLLIDLNNIVDQLNIVYHDRTLSTTHAWWLIEAATKTSRTYLMGHNQKTLSDEEKRWIDEAVEKITCHHKPIQYIIGSVPFLHVTISVEPPILIPRPETEAWVADLIEFLKKSSISPQTILDLCTGSGCIALALAHAFPRSTVDAVDIDNHACTLTQKNILNNRITNVRCLQGDLFSPLDCAAPYNLIVANPPYIPSPLYHQLDASVRLWEAYHALIGEVDGLSIIRRIITQAPHYLQPGGLLCIEIDATQGKIVYDLFEQAHFSDVTIVYDDHQRTRMVFGTYQGN